MALPSGAQVADVNLVPSGREMRRRDPVLMSLRLSAVLKLRTCRLLRAGAMRTPAIFRTGRETSAMDGIGSYSMMAKMSPAGLSDTVGVGGASRMSTTSLGGSL